ncbi:MAG: cobalt-precorrin-5B (C(1))-methyltransferase CbiD [Prevotella sp.]|nr:cobalt-precorrin-5B (C(1))-methyltransferase CbiD [Prevotella sp.]
MLEEYIYRGAKKLRCGYTTGSCAAAAAKASAEMLLTCEKQDFSEIVTPKGIALKLEILNAEISGNSAVCAVKKDGGDDPDVTDGMLIFAEANFIPSGIEIAGGTGIGRVTKAGLDQPVGEYAINSVPRKMIISAIEEISEKYDYHGGFKLIISAPDGAEIAKKTYNPRMGIEGGISIIGTTGIVEPMSNSALIETIRVEAKMRKTEGCKSLLLTIGNYSRNFIQNSMPFDLEKSVKCSNFIGEAIDIAMEFGFENILIIGHIGKLVKLGAGIMNTHSAQADGRMDVLVTCGVLAGADINCLKKIPECVTVDAALDILEKNDILRNVLDVLAKRTDFYLNAKVKNLLKIGVVMFSEKQKITVKTMSADMLINIISEEYNG